MKFVNRSKETLKFVIISFYALFCKLFLSKARRSVIYYHSINKSDVTGFKKQMSYLAANCYVVKPSEIMMTSEEGAQAIVAITFDDAFVSVLENAVPILKEYELSAGIFVPVGNLGELPHWHIPISCADRSQRIMSKEQIAKLDKNGFEIYSHTLSHPKLTELSDDSLITELKDSKQILEEMVGHEVIGISYPYGIHDDRVWQIARECGYRLGFTINPHMVDYATDPFKIGRFRVSSGDGIFKFKLKVSGAYEMVKFLSAIKMSIIRILQLMGS